MGDLDRLKLAVERWLRPFAAKLDYAGHYAASVVAQNADGSLELKGDAPQLASVSKVPIAYGVPGITAVIAKGGEVLVGFINADPALPYALVHDAASVTSIALLGGTKPMARLGDGCAVFLPTGAIFAGTLTTPSGPAPFAGPAVKNLPFAGILNSGQGGAKG